MRKTEVLVKYQVIYLKPIRILYNLMVEIFTIPLQTWILQQCVPVTLNIMGYRTGNMCYVVVISAQVFSYPVRSQIKTQQTCVQKYYFIFTVFPHILLCKDYVHTMNEQHFQRVPQC